MERDENYLPRARSELNMAPQESMKKADYEEIFGETPVYTLLRMAVMQLLGWQLYLTYNTLGSPMYPPGTNVSLAEVFSFFFYRILSHHILFFLQHWFPSSALFKKSDRVSVIITNIGLSLWLTFLGVWIYNTSLATFTKYYFIPYMLTNHWIVMFTYLQHTDPTMPHFRKDTWTFLRGASTTVDRPLLGWMGRFFLHNVSHDHVAHHFFSSIPFYNGPELSKHVRKALGEDYNSDSTNTWRALYRSLTNYEVCLLWLSYSCSVVLDCTQSSSLKMMVTSLCGRTARGWLFARLTARWMRRSSGNVLVYFSSISFLSCIDMMFL